MWRFPTRRRSRPGIHACGLPSCRRRTPRLRNHERRRGTPAMAWRGQTRNDDDPSAGGARLHEKHLGPVRSGLEVDRRLVLDLGRAALVKLRSDQGAVDHEEVATESGTELVTYLSVRLEQGGVHRGV